MRPNILFRSAGPTSLPAGSRTEGHPVVPVPPDGAVPPAEAGGDPRHSHDRPRAARDPLERSCRDGKAGNDARMSAAHTAAARGLAEREASA